MSLKNKSSFFPSRHCADVIHRNKRKRMLCFIMYQSNVIYLHTGLDKSEFGECTHANRKPLNSSRCPSLSQHTICNYVLCKLQTEHYTITHDIHTMCTLNCLAQGFKLYTCSLIKSLNTNSFEIQSIFKGELT